MIHLHRRIPGLDFGNPGATVLIHCNIATCSLVREEEAVGVRDADSLGTHHFSHPPLAIWPQRISTWAKEELRYHSSLKETPDICYRVKRKLFMDFIPLVTGGKEERITPAISDCDTPREAYLMVGKSLRFEDMRHYVIVNSATSFFHASLCCSVCYCRLSLSPLLILKAQWIFSPIRTLQAVSTLQFLIY